MDELADDRPSVAPYIWLAVVGATAAYLYWALALLSLDAIDTIAGDGRGQTVAYPAVLMTTPPLVWVACYAMVRGQYTRRVCPALYATALVLPLTLVGLVFRVAMGSGL